MRKIYKSAFLIALLSLTHFALRSQDFLGMHNSNYLGATGAISNPANIADNRLKFDLTLGGINQTVENNYLSVKRSALDFSGSIFKPATILVSINNNRTSNNRDSADYFQNYMQTFPIDNYVSLYANTRVVLPSFMFAVGKKGALALNIGIRNYVNIDGISPELAEAAYNEFKDTMQWLKGITSPNVNINQMAWAEYGLTYAHVIKDDGKHFFKAGGTVKLLQGLAASYVSIKNLNFVIDTTSIYSFISSDITYGYSDNMDFSNPSQSQIKLKSSFGVGFDVGGVYEWRPNYQEYKYNMDGQTDLWRKDQNKYKLKASFAINDIGGIKYKRGQYSNDFSAKINYWDLGVLDTVSGVKSFDSLMKATFPSNATSSTFKMSLPTHINAQVDYHLGRCYYLNLSANIGNASNYGTYKLHEFTTISLAPRIDLPWFGISAPVTYNSLSAQHAKDLMLGACLRLGPLIIGTNDILNYFSGNIYGASAYMLLKIPIPYTRTIDTDKDNISDKLDMCDEVPGIWEFKGCPDKDDDHIQDSEDLCPDIAGTKELQGCPDKDGDRITDANDACPDSAGTIEFNGCPDRDGDKVIDRLDLCPDTAGLAEFKGCPDRDLDGTPDKDDACPSLFGPKEYNGCPDKDGDKVLDPDDACPEVAGPVENKGCPWPDTDKDGIFDKDDSCKTVPGVPQFKGCPPPPPPQLKAAEKRIIEKAFASLEFATAKDIIKPKSFPSLNALAKLLVEHQADWSLKLAGHTDNEGDPEKNMTLSEKRATAVKNYLVKKGAKADNIGVEWFGSTQPIADNKTPQGRQKNRRVEMKIVIIEQVQ